MNSCGYMNSCGLKSLARARTRRHSRRRGPRSLSWPTRGGRVQRCERPCDVGDIPKASSASAASQALRKSYKRVEVTTAPRSILSIERSKSIELVSNRVFLELNRKSKSLSPQEAVGDTHQALVNHRQTTAHSRPSDLLLIHFARRPRGDEARGG